MLVSEEPRGERSEPTVTSWFLRHLNSFPCRSDTIPDDELNLLYVAVTRAKTTLIITKTICRILTVAGVRHDRTTASGPHASAAWVLFTYLNPQVSLYNVRTLCFGFVKERCSHLTLRQQPNVMQSFLTISPENFHFRTEMWEYKLTFPVICLYKWSFLPCLSSPGILHEVRDAQFLGEGGWADPLRRHRLSQLHHTGFCLHHEPTEDQMRKNIHYQTTVTIWANILMPPNNILSLRCE